MTDPNVGFSIYISDREREKIELERRRAAASTNPKPLTQSLVSAPVTLPIASILPQSSSAPSQKEEAPTPVSVASSGEVAAPTDEEIFERLKVQPIVSVSNVTDDDTPWRTKYALERIAKFKSVCENCDKCDGYEANDKKVGICSCCNCELIFHLKSVDFDTTLVEDDDNEEEEWEEDEEDGEDDDYFDGDDGDDPGPPGPGVQLHIEEEEEEYDGAEEDGGEES
jgi:hypothetical protein